MHLPNEDYVTEIALVTTKTVTDFNIFQMNFHYKKVRTLNHYEITFKTYSCMFYYVSRHMRLIMLHSFHYIVLNYTV